MRVRVAHRGASPVTVACSLIDGRMDDALLPLQPREVGLDPGAVGSMTWSASENFGTRWKTPGLTCRLRPGAEIGWFELRLFEAIGA